MTEDLSGKSGINPPAQNNHEMVEQMSDEYRNYLKVDTTKEFGQFTQSIDQMLTQLEEYGGLVDLIRSDNRLALSNTLPQICEKSKQMAPLFQKIDRLEDFIRVVQTDLDNVERLVSHAETDLSRSGSIQRLFNSLSPIFSGSAKEKQAKPPQVANTVGFVSPKIFRTGDYFVHDANTNTGRAELKDCGTNIAETIQNPPEMISETTNTSDVLHDSGRATHTEASEATNIQQ